MGSCEGMESTKGDKLRDAGEAAQTTNEFPGLGTTEGEQKKFGVMGDL